ncbi:MAG TPA: hypothetical protein VMX35_08880 [Acidobacteriota bacterium]|nr:hypothetical protein [Acidobacteriota bacterium]
MVADTPVEMVYVNDGELVAVEGHIHDISPKAATLKTDQVLSTGQCVILNFIMVNSDLLKALNLEEPEEEAQIKFRVKAEILEIKEVQGERYPLSAAVRFLGPFWISNLP